MNSTLTIKNVFGIVILSVVSALVVGTIIASVGLVYLPEENTVFANYLALFVGQGFMIVPLLLFLVARKEPLLRRLRIRKISFPVIITSTILSIGLIVIVDEFDRLSSSLFTPPEFLNQMGTMLKFDSFGMALFLMFGIVLLAPLSEELLFRGFLQKFLEEHWQDITRAVLVTSLFFALIHLNPFWLIQIYVLGVMLGYLAWKTGSIWAGFILHAANNFVALMFTNYDESLVGFYTWNGHVAPWILLLGVICIYYGFTGLNKTAKVQA
ncbi:MAG: CPBP family intramembrane metalloprotease [Candidatus Marinimicrobia bacterium]|nr:CPBP family intramembrane metalloprotease [Candidatus Neomarinimicrobiota bacterium]